MIMNQKESFINLIRLGIDANMVEQFSVADWHSLQIMAEKHGLMPIIVDGIDKVSGQDRPPKQLLLNWIGEEMKEESRYVVQQKWASELAQWFHEHNIRTYVLKGAVVAECYPKQEHRVSSDFDCFLLPENVIIDSVWKTGNEIVQAKGFAVKTDYYKNSTFLLPDLTVENHRFLTPFRGNKKLRVLEIMLQGQLKEDKGNNRFDGTWLCRPPVMVTALFLIEHAYSHFLHEGLTWRHVLDWMMFKRKHGKEIDWSTLNAGIDEFGFRRFYDSYEKLGQYLLGEVDEDELTANDKRMLADVWADLDLHETVKGFKGKIAIAGNTWRARWKYHYFADISMMHAFWIQVKGFFFIREPKLN